MADVTVDKYLWVEKYRPKELSEMILPEEYSRTFGDWITQQQVPNALFVGRPGSGKTTLARILVTKIIKAQSDLLYLNGSTQRGIAIVKEQIEDFLKTIIYGKSKIKIVFIDEFDYMTGDAQAALRNVIESYTENGRFLLTANYEFKISEAIMSRMQTFRFKELPKEYMLEYVSGILKKENVEYDEEAVKKIINIHHPDVRKIVGICQARSREGKLSYALSDIESNENKLRSLITDLLAGIETKNRELVNRAVEASRKILSECEIDFNSLYEKMGNDQTIPIWVVQPIAAYYDKNNSTASPNMNYLALLNHIIKAAVGERNSAL